MNLLPRIIIPILCSVVFASPGQGQARRNIPPAANYALRATACIKAMSQVQEEMDETISLMRVNANAWNQHERDLVSNGILEADAESKRYDNRHKSLIPRLLKPMSVVRAQAKILQNLSPVPKSCIKADRFMESSGLEFEKGLNALKKWIYHGDGKDKKLFDYHYNRALNFFESGLKALPKPKEPRNARKTYISG